MIIERLSNRLKAVASFVEKDAVVADIGSDHAYLPCFLIKTGKIQRAVAGEVAKGPYDSAMHNVKKEGLAAVVTVRLANGLLAIEEKDAVDTVTIAGMGGSLIASILENGKSHLQGVKRIITQPNIHAESIRKWAVSNGWEIKDEHIMKEDGKIYEIIVLVEGISSYDELDLLLGPLLRVEKSSVFLEKWMCELEEWQRVLNSLEKAKATEAIEMKIEQLTRHIELVGKVLEP
ncbi:tRNA (adenine(22)-N(1))-methyltransferase [Sporosarcina sp. G11-34]|uniref:tRNA (adenine(22)-N(1))-methyltransferase n=1 Tax=Sporosarcina sp. G11-34 TaxID=2849605 RepID=UPI0022A90799|nr:tRNA (adenine(22)-N(1))-methyltransferase TrmK [Sporosarcina sp. G11-34]MCZ2259345.1 tRNA (adenine(22)-N(1))-methyltransferase TrmK [Sporosarcina sp. G11-34]